MQNFLFASFAAAVLLLTAPGCKKEGCEAAAEMAQKCVDRAKDESVEELTGECKNALENERSWAQASIDCAEEHSDCDKFNACVAEKSN